MALTATVQGTIVTYGKRVFKNNEGEAIEWVEIVLVDPTDQRNPTQAFSVETKCAHENKLDVTGEGERELAGVSVLLTGDLSSSVKKSVFKADGGQEYTKYVPTIKFKVTKIDLLK